MDNYGLSQAGWHRLFRSSLAAAAVADDLPVHLVEPISPEEEEALAAAAFGPQGELF